MNFSCAAEEEKKYVYVKMGRKKIRSVLTYMEKKPTCTRVYNNAYKLWQDTKFEYIQFV